MTILTSLLILSLKGYGAFFVDCKEPGLFVGSHSLASILTYREDRKLNIQGHWQSRLENYFRNVFSEYSSEFRDFNRGLIGFSKQGRYQFHGTTQPLWVALPPEFVDLIPENCLSHASAQVKEVARLIDSQGYERNYIVDKSTLQSLDKNSLIYGTLSTFFNELIPDYYNRIQLIDFILTSPTLDATQHRAVARHFGLPLPYRVSEKALTRVMCEMSHQAGKPRFQLPEFIIDRCARLTHIGESLCAEQGGIYVGNTCKRCQDFHSTPASCWE